MKKCEHERCAVSYCDGEERWTCMECKLSGTSRPSSRPIFLRDIVRYEKENHHEKK